MALMAVPFVGMGSNHNVSGHIIGRSIKAGIEKFDRSILGVDVEIGHLTVNPFDGYVDCEHLIVHNPPGYSSPHLLKAEKVLLDIDMCILTRSCMQKISIEKIVFKDITAIYEKKWGASNLQDVLEHLDRKDKGATTPASASQVKESHQDTPNEAEASDPKPAEYEVHRVEVQNACVNVRPAGVIGDYINVDMEAGNVYYKDFNSEVGASTMDDIAMQLLKALLKTVLSNVAGKHAAQYLM